MPYLLGKGGSPGAGISGFHLANRYSLSDNGEGEKGDLITMTKVEETILRIRELPEPLIDEVHDLVEFLQMRKNPDRWGQWRVFNENLSLAESGMDGYLKDLCEYEEKLANGEIRW